jgi:hypothetical protein
MQCNWCSNRLTIEDRGLTCRQCRLDGHTFVGVPETDLRGHEFADGAIVLRNSLRRNGDEVILAVWPNRVGIAPSKAEFVTWLVSRDRQFIDRFAGHYHYTLQAADADFEERTK